MFSAKDVKELREATGCGMMDCKKALTESNGDQEKAIELLREKGLAAAAKKAGRIASEGIVKAYITDDKKVGVLLEVNSETDFVAKNEEFQTFVTDVARHIAAVNPSNVDELLSQKFFEGGDATIGDMLTEKIAKIGENMSIRRFERFEGDVFSYIHGEGRIGVLVKFDTDVAGKDGFDDFAKDIAMQIAAAFPQYLNKEDVPSETLDKEKEILRAQALNEGKPEAIVDKMVMGRINKYYKEFCLVEQEYIKDQDMTVNKYVKDVASKLGGNIEISAYARFEKGEGLQKKEENFADEVANMMK